MRTEVENTSQAADPTNCNGAPLIYIAAPYTRPDPVENTHRAVRIADALLDAGIIPLVPHLSLLWHLISPKPYYRWLDYDGQLLLRCDALLRVPGYSDGATLECTLAETRGMTVLRPLSDSPAECVSIVIDWLSSLRMEVS